MGSAGARRRARHLLATCRTEGQAAWRIPDDRHADEVRRELRAMARAEGLRIRTARMADNVAVVLVDSALWDQNAATMRRALEPPN